MAVAVEEAPEAEEVVEWWDYNELVGEDLPVESKNLLLGNGFSIACSGRFSYENLYEQAASDGLSEAAHRLFHHLGTTNFENVLRAFDEDEFLDVAYEGTPPADGGESDKQQLKLDLIRAIAENHMERRSDIGEEWLDLCQRFLSDYQEVFTTNYDLLLYWVQMFGGNPAGFEDGFRRDEESGRLVYEGWFNKGKPRVHYIHGALHLYLQEEDVYKHEADGATLLSIIAPAFDRGEYPLFVAEGDSRDKFTRIRDTPYLHDAYRRFMGLDGSLTIFGHSLSDQDKHIRVGIAVSERLESLAVGTRHGPGHHRFEAIVNRVDEIQGMRAADGRDLLEVYYFEADTAAVWSPAVSWAELAARLED